MKKFFLIFLLSVATLFGAVNLNTASKDELMSISGIGEKKALAIIEYRKTHKFNKIEDIKMVKGIGDKIFEKIKNDISVDTSKKPKETMKH